MEVNEKLQIAKQGVNLIRTIADENNCFFHEIQQENDVGIDAIIELSQHNHLTGTNIAVQIKTGNSLFHYRIIDFLAIGTSNPDVFRSGADYEVCERNAHLTIIKMSKADVIKLLAYVDSENGFERGSTGEWVDFIIQAIPNSAEILQEIIGDHRLSTEIRENALFLFASYEPAAFLKLESGKVLDRYEMLSNAIEKYGGIFPYM